MKPFITPELSAAGKKLLRYQCEGIEAADLWNTMQGRSVIAYSMPAGHSFQAAWLLRLILSGSASLEFSSACTEVVGWHEVGSLNVRLVRPGAAGVTDAEIGMPVTSIPEVRLSAIQKIVYEDDDVITECGMALGGDGGVEVIVAAGVPPGSVSLAAPFTCQPFEPQFPLSACRREAL